MNLYAFCGCAESCRVGNWSLKLSFHAIFLSPSRQKVPAKCNGLKKQRLFILTNKSCCSKWKLHRNSSFWHSIMTYRLGTQMLNAVCNAWLYLLYIVTMISYCSAGMGTRLFLLTLLLFALFKQTLRALAIWRKTKALLSITPFTLSLILLPSFSS